MEILREIRRSGFSFQRLSGIYSELNQMKGVPQNPVYHSEGDVFRHTEMVCDCLLTLPEWSELEQEEQELLFLAAAFHDIGKVFCTKQEDGNWVSPNHTIIGEKKFRWLAYKNTEQFGLTFSQREKAAKLIRFHGLPVWFWTKDRTAFDLIKAAESIPLRLLYLLSKADVQGRVAKEADELEVQVALFADYAKELGIWEQPYVFANPYTKYQYFHREGLWHQTVLCDSTEFDVVMLSGLPLAGKDTWIAEHGRGLPVVLERDKHYSGDQTAACWSVCRIWCAGASAVFGSALSGFICQKPKKSTLYPRACIGGNDSKIRNAGAVGGV